MMRKAELRKMGDWESIWLAGSCLLKRHIQLPLAKYGQNDYDGRTLEGLAWKTGGTLLLLLFSFV